jgi:cysteine synthase
MRWHAGWRARRRVFTGTSSGLKVIAALRVAARLGPEATVATVAIDPACAI